jgi:hypothetical protein
MLLKQTVHRSREHRLIFGTRWSPAQPTTEPAKEDSGTMKRDEQEYGNVNPNAPPELSRFAFLIAKWRCNAALKRGDRTWESLKATWEGRLILDGYVCC